MGRYYLPLFVIKATIASSVSLKSPTSIPQRNRPKISCCKYLILTARTMETSASLNFAAVRSVFLIAYLNGRKRLGSSVIAAQTALKKSPLLNIGFKVRSTQASILLQRAEYSCAAVADVMSSL